MMIDIHTHIIPFVDDGADNWEVSLQLLKQGESQGIVAAVATPHVLSENDYRFEEDIITKFNELQQRAQDAGLKMKLYLGSEIYAQPDMTLNHQISTINNNKKYFLVEFPMTSIPRFVAGKFFDFILDEKIPIIAHPERNIGFQNKSILAYEFVNRGALMQVNALSLMGKHGERAKTLALKLIAHNLVHFIASDCHDHKHRVMKLTAAYNIVVEKFGKTTADLLFYENPKKAVAGEKIDTLEPIPLENLQTKKSLWQKIKDIKL